MKFRVPYKELYLRDDFTYIPAHIQHSDPKVADSHAKLNENFSKLNLKTSIYVLSKTRKLQYTNRVNLSLSSLYILWRHYRHIFAVFYPLQKINSSRHNIIMAFEIMY